MFSAPSLTTLLRMSRAQTCRHHSVSRKRKEKEKEKLKMKAEGRKKDEGRRKKRKRNKEEENHFSFLGLLPSFLSSVLFQIGLWGIFLWIPAIDLVDHLLL